MERRNVLEVLAAVFVLASALFWALDPLVAESTTGWALFSLACGVAAIVRRRFVEAAQ